MKNLIMLILTLTLSACAGRKNSSTTSDNQLQELGTCSSAFTTELNAAEWSLNLYKDYGLRNGKDLVQAHIDYGTIKTKYRTISCQAINRDTGEVITITQQTIDTFLKEVFDALYSAHFDKCKSSITKSLEEKGGCSQISFYMNKTFGYE
ncbi:MAG: hypothetical protein ACXVCP_08525 [Bdellovibrio sp.]